MRLKIQFFAVLLVVGAFGPTRAQAGRFASLSLEERRARMLEVSHSFPQPVPAVPSVPVALELAYRYTYPGGSMEIINAQPALWDLMVERDIPYAAAFFPDRFIISDGALEGRILSVNKRPGTRLAGLVDEIVDQILGLYDLDQPSQLWPLTLVDFLAAQTQDYLVYPEKGGIPDPAPGLSSAVWNSQSRLMSSLAGAEIGTRSALIAGYQHPVRNYDDALVIGRGVCLDMILLDSFVLERFGIRHRVVLGAVVDATREGESYGHGWIELPDGTILDPTWKTHSMPQPYGDAHPDWKVFGNAIGKQPRFGYPSYPIIPFF